MLTHCHRYVTVLAAGLLALAAASAVRAAAPSGYHVTATWQIGGNGFWDCATVDHAAHRLYVTRGDHVQVIDTTTGKLAANITGLQRSHDVALVPALNRGFISDGGAADVVVFDLKTDKILGKIPAAPDADIALYDPSSDRVFVVCGDAHKLLSFAPDVDLQSPKVESLDLGAAPEFLVADGHGKVYVNLSDKSQVAAVDIKSMKILAHYPLGSGEHPTGLAYDPTANLLFSACRNSKLVVMHAGNGQIETTLTIPGGTDGAGFVRGAALASCGAGSLAVATRGADGTWSVAEVKTAQGARTMAADEQTGDVYLPTARFEAGTPGRRRPPMISGSFEILVLTPGPGQ